MFHAVTKHGCERRPHDRFIDGRGASPEVGQAEIDLKAGNKASKLPVVTGMTAAIQPRDSIPPASTKLRAPTFWVKSLSLQP